MQGDFKKLVDHSDISIIQIFDFCACSKIHTLTRVILSDSLEKCCLSRGHISGTVAKYRGFSGSHTTMWKGPLPSF